MMEYLFHLFSDIIVDSSDLHVDFSKLYDDLSIIHMLEKILKRYWYCLDNAMQITTKLFEKSTQHSKSHQNDLTSLPDKLAYHIKCWHTCLKRRI